MICPQCGGKIKVTHTYVAGRKGKTQASKCIACKTAWTLVTVVIGEHKQGRGAYAVAQQLQDGYSYKVELHRDPPTVAS